jgi:hypothetical protein
MSRLKQETPLTHEYPDFWYELATALDMTVELVPRNGWDNSPGTENKMVYIVDKAGRKIWVMLVFEGGKWSISINSSYPRNQIFQGSYGEPVNIHVSESRPAGAIAKDIQRRFLPLFVPRHDESARKAREDWARWNDLMERLEEVIPGLEMPRQDVGSQYTIERRKSAQKDNGTGVVNVTVSGSVDLTFNGHIDDPLTMAMLVTLMRYAPAGDKPVIKARRRG